MQLEERALQSAKTMAWEKGLTEDQTKGFLEYLVQIDRLANCANGRLVSRQIIALALVTYCSLEGI